MKSVVLVLILLSQTIFAKINHGTAKKDLQISLMKAFSKKLGDNDLKRLKSSFLRAGGDSVSVLVKVMKDKNYPDKNRWLATFLLGQVMGKKGSPYLSKFMSHPNWVLRLASLKTLLALKEKRYGLSYAEALKDRSLLVRKQALENIKYLKIKEAAPYVWSMLYDRKNYYTNNKSAKRTNLIKEAIKTVGVLKFEKALDPLLTMVQKEKYRDIFSEIDSSLEKITGKKSPQKNLQIKRRFWKKVAQSYVTI